MCPSFPHLKHCPAAQYSSFSFSDSWQTFWWLWLGLLWCGFRGDEPLLDFPFSAGVPPLEWGVVPLNGPSDALGVFPHDLPWDWWWNPKVTTRTDPSAGGCLPLELPPAPEVAPETWEVCPGRQSRLSTIFSVILIISACSTTFLHEWQLGVQPISPDLTLDRRSGAIPELKNLFLSSYVTNHVE